MRRHDAAKGKPAQPERPRGHNTQQHSHHMLNVKLRVEVLGDRERLSVAGQVRHMHRVVFGELLLIVRPVVARAHATMKQHQRFASARSEDVNFFVVGG